MTEDERFNILVEVRVLKQRVEDFVLKTDEYRISLCNKMDRLLDKINALPCPERKGLYHNLNNQIKALWAIVILMLGVIAAEWFKK